MAFNYNKNTLNSFNLRNSKRKTLNDLEKDDRFLEVSERFLASVGENSDDIFEYLRDSDFNLVTGMSRAMQSGNFTEQQKRDYAYLRSEFDGAKLGGLRQFGRLIKDAAIDIATDPTLVVAALTAPFTGGTSLAGRQAIATAATQAAKSHIPKSFVGPIRPLVGPVIPESAITGLLKEEGKKSVKKAAAFGAVEGGAWLGLDNHFRQTTELNTDLRKLYSAPELVGSTALGVLTGGLLAGGLQKANLYYDKMNRLYADEGYHSTKEGSFADKITKTLEFGDKVKAVTIGSATSILDTKAKFSPVARELRQLIREDADKTFGSIYRKKVELGHAEQLDNLRSEYHALFDEATAPIRKTGVVNEVDELNVVRILRGDDATKYNDTVQTVAGNLRVLYNRVFDDAIEAGLIEPDRKLTNYFTRNWNRKMIEENRQEFEQKLISEKIVKDSTEANLIIDDMLNLKNELFSSHSILLTQARAFKNLDDNAFEKFLTNDLNSMTTYYMNAANTIQHKKSFLLPEFTNKSNIKQFEERWIIPMDNELRAARGQGRGLTKGNRNQIIKLYKSVTGQVNYFDSGLIQGIYDGTKLANAMAFLPLATVSSITEALIPLTKSGGKGTSAVTDALKGVKEGHKIFVQDIPLMLKRKYKMPDSQIQKEMHQVFLAMDEAFAESTNRLTGEGLQNEFTKKIGRGFFRFNMLTPWTKSVQLASFNVGKGIIKENLEALDKLSKQGINVISEATPVGVKDLSRSEVRNIQKLKNDLFGLGIDIEDGLRWLNDGAKTTFGPARDKNGLLTGEIAYADDFYKSVIQGAGRFVNQVIMPVGRDRARIPIYMTNPKVDIFTQFLRYPTVFSNTVLKNYINDVIVNPKVNAAKVGAFALTATSIALATNYWRSSPENRDRIAEEGFQKDEITNAFKRVGMLGPLEQGIRFGDSLEYTKNPFVSFASLGGPAVSDIMQLILGRKGITETLAGKIPLTGTKNIMNRTFGDNPFDYIRKNAKEIDKEAAYRLRIKDRPLDKRYTRNYTRNYTQNYATGGFVRQQYFEGEKVSKDFPVPDTKENPADRVDPFTGMPYADQMARLGFDGGGGVDYESLGRQYTDDPLIAKIIGVESGGVVDKVSPAGAKGLMQIMPNTAEQPGFGVKPFQGNDLFNPIENVKFGTAYFYGLKKEFKNTRDTAIAYNWGHNNTKKWLEEGADLNKLPKETRNYIKKLNIDENLREQKQEGGGVNSLTPQVSDDYLESTQPFINPSFITPFFINENDNIPEGAIRIYEEEQGLKPVFPIIELLLGGPAFRGGKIVKESAEQIIAKKTMPKSVVHGSQYKGLKKIKSSSAQALEQVGKTNEGLQAAIFTSRPTGVATQYGKNGQLYTVDTSNISRGALFNFGKDKVLNTSNVPDSLIQNLNKKINDLTVAGPTRKAASLNQFKKSLVSKEGVTFISPTTKDFLIDNNYKVIQTKLFKDPHFILLDDVVKVK